MIIGNQKFREKFQIDFKTAATIMRMAGAIFLGFFLDGNISVMFVRPNGVEGTWVLTFSI